MKISIVIPTVNSSKIIAGNIKKLDLFLKENKKINDYETRITEIEADITSIELDIAAIQTDIVDLQEQIDFQAILIGTGSPEGVVSAQVGQEYMDDAGTASAIKYIKRDADGGGEDTQGGILIYRGPDVRGGEREL